MAKKKKVKKVVKKAIAKSKVVEKKRKVKKKAVAVQKKPIVKKAVVEKKKPIVKKKAAKKSANAGAPLKMSLLERIELAVTNKHGPETIMTFKAKNRAVPIAFGSGIPELDDCIGVGGYPKGRIIEVYGPESSGKTTLSLHAIAECQKAGGVAQFIDAEHALDAEYAQKLNVNLEKLLISQPDSGEMALNIAESAMNEIIRTPEKDRKPNIIVIDSVAALTPQSEIDGEIDKHGGTAEQARMMSKALRKLCGLVSKSGTVLMFINQTRDKLNFGYGSSKGTTGGNALKFYASIRIAVQHVGKEKLGDEVIGNNTQVTIVKNKMAPPFKKFTCLIRFGIGFDLKSGQYKSLLKVEDVVRSGSWITLPDGQKFQGYWGFLKFIEDDDNDEYVTLLLSGKTLEAKKMKKPTVDDDEVEDDESDGDVDSEDAESDDGEELDDDGEELDDDDDDESEETNV